MQATTSPLADKNFRNLSAAIAAASGMGGDLLAAKWQLPEGSRRNFFADVHDDYRFAMELYEGARNYGDFARLVRAAEHLMAAWARIIWAGSMLDQPINGVNVWRATNLRNVLAEALQKATQPHCDLLAELHDLGEEGRGEVARRIAAVEDVADRVIARGEKRWARVEIIEAATAVHDYVTGGFPKLWYGSPVELYRAILDTGPELPATTATHDDIVELLMRGLTPPQAEFVQDRMGLPDCLVDVLGSAHGEGWCDDEDAICEAAGAMYELLRRDRGNAWPNVRETAARLLHTFPVNLLAAIIEDCCDGATWVCVAEDEPREYARRRRVAIAAAEKVSAVLGRTVTAATI